VTGKIPINNQIAYNLQNILNLLPNLNVEELVKAILVKTNDLYLVMYVSSLIRAILALHDLLNNKLKYKNLDDLVEQQEVTELAASNNNNNNNSLKKDKVPSSPGKKDTPMDQDGSSETK
jgi:26S proteasome regulatory subunit N8